MISCHSLFSVIMSHIQNEWPFTRFNHTVVIKMKIRMWATIQVYGYVYVTEREKNASVAVSCEVRQEHFLRSFWTGCSTAHIATALRSSILILFFCFFLMSTAKPHLRSLLTKMCTHYRNNACSSCLSLCLILLRLWENSQFFSLSKSALLNS